MNFVKQNILTVSDQDKVKIVYLVILYNSAHLNCE